MIDVFVLGRALRYIAEEATDLFCWGGGGGGNWGLFFFTFFWWTVIGWKDFGRFGRGEGLASL